MSNVYFPVSRYHLTNIYMKENWNTDCVVNVKSNEISNELGQSLPRLHIYPNFAQNSESESLAKRPKRIRSKIDLNVIRDPNIPLGLKLWRKYLLLELFSTSLVFFTSIFRLY